ncbi:MULTISPECIES: hypothetical protein [Curtobacterium]|uniref:hypothetical protein n=1 Tax=Curtobacterium flaccumfaciens TaxID=2035 RepID=UPI003EE7D7CE
MTPTAFVDESEPGDRRDPGVYILGAVSVPDDRGDQVRDALTALKPRSAHKLHWTESDGHHRAHIVAALCGLPMAAVGVVSLTDVAVRSERRRRLAIERLIVELTASGVDQIVFESRGPSDRHDRAHIDGLRARRVVSGVRSEHVPGVREPLLWAADAVCGVVSLDRRGESGHRRALGARLVIHEHRR